MRLILIRHAETEANARHQLDTAYPGADLTEAGRAQAEELVAALDGVSIDRIAVSSRVRTGQTAAPLAAARGLTPMVVDELHEISAGELEMRSDMDSIRAYLDVTFRWGDGELDLRIPGAESGTEVLDRFDAGIALASDGLDEDATLAVVAHGAVIRVWSALRGENVPRGFGRTHVVRNTGRVELVREADAWFVESWMGTPLPR